MTRHRAVFNIADTRTRPDIPETDVQIDGIAELWYDDLDSLQQAAATPEMKPLTTTARCLSARSRPM